MDFILSQNNLLILAIAVLAGIMLLIPSFFKGRAGRAVSSSEAVQMVNQKDAILIDLRSADQFKAGAIAQSRNIPAADLDAKAGTLMITHGPVKSLDWPAMTMTFALANPGIARGFKAGDRVRFGFDRPPAGPTLRHMAKVAGQ